MPIDYSKFDALEPLDFDPDAGVLRDPEAAARRHEADQAHWLTDSLMAVPRGIAGAVEGVGEIGNLIPGVDYDIPENLGFEILGESETVPGSMVEGAVQFLSGFLPGSFGIGHLSKISRGSSALRKGLSLTKKAERAARIAGKTGAVRRIRWGRSMTAGSFADFMVFTADEERLSNLIQSIPALENPITEFLQSDGEDTEIEGRIKNAIEGAGLGVLADGILAGIRAIWKRGKVLSKAGGLTDAEVEELARKHEVELRAIDEEAQESAGRALGEPVDDVERNLLEDEAAVPGRPLEPEEIPQDLQEMSYRDLQQEARKHDLAGGGPGRTAAVLREEIHRARLVEETEPARPTGYYDEAAGRASRLPTREGLVGDQINGWERAALEAGGTTLEETRAIGDVLEEAHRSGEDPQEAIRGIINLAKLDPVSHRRMVKIIAELPGVNEFTDELGKPVNIKDLGEQAAEAAEHYISKYFGRRAETVLHAARGTERGLDKARRETFAQLAYLSHYFEDLDKVYEAMRTGRKDLLDELGFKSQDEATETWMQGFETGALLVQQIGRVRYQWGLGLGGYRLGPAKLMSDEMLEEVIQGRGGREYLTKLGRKFHEVRSRYGNSAAAQMMMGFDRKRRMVYLTNEYFMNFILSGLRTMSTNTFGSLATTYYGPLETYLGARVGQGLASLKGESVEAFREEADRAWGALVQLRHQFDIALKWGLKSWKSGRGHLDERFGTLEVPREMREAMSSENVSAIVGRDLDPEEGVGRAINIFGGYLRMPSRFLLATDEFFKQWQYRSAVASDLALQGNKKGLSGPELDRWVDTELAQMTRQGQAFSREHLYQRAALKHKVNMYVDPEKRDEAIERYVERHWNSPEVQHRGVIAKKALEIARERTFTTDVGARDGILSDMGGQLQSFSFKHPMVRLFTPFIRTPLNILIYAGRRSLVWPRNLTGVSEYLLNAKLGRPESALANSKRLLARQLASSDPRERAEALGRMSAAVGFMSVGLGAANSGLITGSGPADPAHRKLLRENGWQPYSIKIGDTYVKYAVDPAWTIMGIYADMVDAGRYAPEADQDDIERAGLALWTTLAHNLQSKSYLQGLMQASGLLTDADRTAPKVAGKLLGAFTVPSLVASLRHLTDDNLLEARTVLDQVINRVPFLSTKLLDPQRNILGEPVGRNQLEGALKATDGVGGIFHAFMINRTSSDTVTNELAKLQYGFKLPVRYQWGQDLAEHTNEKGQSAYDRWLELTGEVKLAKYGNRTLKATLKRLINSRDYEALAETGIGEVDLDSPRVLVIQRVLSRFRAEAKRRMLLEFPELTEHAKNITVSREALKSGGDLETIRSTLFPL